MAEIKISYYSYDEKLKEYKWIEEWPGKTIPVAVKLELEFEDEAEEIVKFTKTVEIPMAGS